MIKKYRSLIVILLVVIILVVGLYILTVKFNDLNLIDKSLQIVTNLITIISSVILLAIALIFFNKYGGDQKVVDEQMVRVMNLIKYLSQIRFMIKVVKDGKRQGTIMNLTIFSYDENLKFSQHTKILNGENYNTFAQLMSPDLMDFFNEIVAFGDEQYMPKIIKSKIDILEHNMPKFSTTFEDVEVPKTYLIAVLNTGSRINIIQKTDPIITTYGVNDQRVIMQLRYDEIIKDLRNIYSTANKWLKINNAGVYDSLNIQTLPNSRKR